MSSPLRILAAEFAVSTAGAVAQLKTFDKQLTQVAGAFGKLAETALAAFSVHAVAG